MSTLNEFEWEEIEETDAIKTFMSHAPYYPEGFIKSKPGGLVMPRCFPAFFAKMADFVPRDNDVWVASYPKAGTTWTQEMVWNIVHDCDFETAKSKTMDERYAFLETGGIMTAHVEQITRERCAGMGLDDLDAFMDIWMKSVETAEAWPKDQTRMIKTHLPVDFLPKDC